MPTGQCQCGYSSNPGLGLGPLFFEGLNIRLKKCRTFERAQETAHFRLRAPLVPICIPFTASQALIVRGPLIVSGTLAVRGVLIEEIWWQQGLWLSEGYDSQQGPGCQEGLLQSDGPVIATVAPSGQTGPDIHNSPLGVERLSRQTVKKCPDIV